MASTRNKNDMGDFKQQQLAKEKFANYYSYETSNYYGVPLTSYYAGDGLGCATMAHRNLSSNYYDIETQLLGIGSTNLVNPMPEVKPELYALKTAHISDRLPNVAVSNFRPEPNQRPLWLN